MSVVMLMQSILQVGSYLLRYLAKAENNESESKYVNVVVLGFQKT